MITIIVSILIEIVIDEKKAATVAIIAEIAAKAI